MLRRFSRRQFLSASAASVGSAGLLAVTSADEPDDDTRHVRIEVEPGEIVTLEIVGMDAPVDEPPPDEPDDPEYPTQMIWHTPQEGTVVSGTITLWVEAPEETAGVWFHHGNWQWLGDDYEGPDYVFQVDTTQYADGGYVFHAQAVDANDQTLDTRTVNVVIDNSGDEPDEPEGQIIWQANHAGGNLNEWTANGGGGVFDSGSGQTTISSTFSRSHGHAVRLSGPASHGGSAGARLFRWREPQQHQALYYSMWFYIPQHYNAASWYHIVQWKSGSFHNAVFALEVRNRSGSGNMFLRLGRGSDSGGGSWSQNVMDLPAEQWVHIRVYYRKASTSEPQNGHIIVWQDGAQIIEMNGESHTAENSGANADLGFAVISYGQGMSPSPAVIYVDDVAISRVDE